MLRFLTAGESHGPRLTAILEGLPAGLHLDLDQLNLEMARRQQGYGRGGRMQIESDRLEVTSGVRFGATLGSPIAMTIQNRDWANWQDTMSVWGPAAGEAVTAPRPGHADLAGSLKYGHQDLRNVLERASARETAARVAVGALCKQLLRQLGVDLLGMVAAIGEVSAALPSASTLLQLRARSEASPVRTPDPDAADRMVAAIDQARTQGDSLGGVFVVMADGLVPGLGSHVHWDRRLDGRLAQALMSIPAVKGVEVGDGFEAAAMPGSRVHDEIFHNPERGYHRLTNHSGGLEGGMTTGEPLWLRVAMKPIATLSTPLRSVDMSTHALVTASKERADICAVPSAAVIGEAVVAFELARVYLEKFSGDTVAQLQASLAAYRQELEQR